MAQDSFLTEQQRGFFLEHGWVRIPNGQSFTIDAGTARSYMSYLPLAIDKNIMQQWMEGLWVRLGFDENDKSTWTDDYLKM